MAKKTKEIRKVLADAIERAGKGELPVEDGKNIIGLANQISNLMSTEVKVIDMKVRLGHQADKFGELQID